MKRNQGEDDPAIIQIHLIKAEIGKRRRGKKNLSAEELRRLCCDLFAEQDFQRAGYKFRKTAASQVATTSVMQPGLAGAT